MVYDAFTDEFEKLAMPALAHAGQHIARTSLDVMEAQETPEPEDHMGKSLGGAATGGMLGLISGGKLKRPRPIKGALLGVTAGALLPLIK